MHRNCLISIRDISIKFDEKIVLDKFSLCVKAGEKVLISAPSGKGKTTLLRILMGFEKAASGEIYIDGLKLDENNIDNMRLKVGYLPQSMPFRNLQVDALIDEILSYKNNLKTSENKEKLKELLKQFSLEEDILKKEIKDLSGGERQRIGIVITILLDKKIWIMDEITSSLDQEMKEKVIEYIGKTDKTVMMVSHDSIKALEKFRKVEL